MLNKHQKEYKETVEKEKVDLGKRPDWLKVRLPSGDNYREVLSMMRRSKLNTVCEEAKCPNLAECWNNRTATYMILGDTCTRTCGFCDVKSGKPTFVDWDEPNRVTQSVIDLGLKHVVITSVNRDELKDGGASIFSKTVSRFRLVLLPDTLISPVFFEMTSML